MNLGRAAGAGVADHIHLHLRAALERGHELHDRGRRDARHPGGPGGGVRAAARAIPRRDREDPLAALLAALVASSAPRSSGAFAGAVGGASLRHEPDPVRGHGRGALALAGLGPDVGARARKDLAGVRPGEAGRGAGDPAPGPPGLRRGRRAASSCRATSARRGSSEAPTVDASALLISRYPQSDPTVFVGTRDRPAEVRGRRPDVSADGAAERPPSTGWNGPAPRSWRRPATACAISLDGGDDLLGRESPRGRECGPRRRPVVVLCRGPRAVRGRGERGRLSLRRRRAHLDPGGPDRRERVYDLVWLGPFLYAAGEQGFYRSDDAGKSWKRLVGLAGAPVAPALSRSPPPRAWKPSWPPTAASSAPGTRGEHWQPAGLEGKEVLLVATFPPPEPMTRGKKPTPMKFVKAHGLGNDFVLVAAADVARRARRPGRAGCATGTAGSAATASSSTRRVEGGDVASGSSTRTARKWSSPATACAAWPLSPCARAGLRRTHVSTPSSGPRPVDVRLLAGSRYRDLHGPRAGDPGERSHPRGPRSSAAARRGPSARRGRSSGARHRHLARQPALRGLPRRAPRRRLRRCRSAPRWSATPSSRAGRTSSSSRRSRGTSSACASGSAASARPQSSGTGSASAAARGDPERPRRPPPACRVRRRNLRGGMARRRPRPSGGRGRDPLRRGLAGLDDGGDQTGFVAADTSRLPGLPGFPRDETDSHIALRLAVGVMPITLACSVH